jgi:tetrahydromethanopterin S-methyltransferase subunit E
MKLGLDKIAYWIFTKLGHMIPLWKGKNPIYFGVIRSKVNVIITINIIFDNRVVSAKILLIVMVILTFDPMTPKLMDSSPSTGQSCGQVW